MSITKEERKPSKPECEMCESVCIDTSIINRVFNTNRTDLLTEAFAGRILCVSTYVVDELDATPDLNTRLGLLKTYNTLISKAKDVREFWTWEHSFVKEHNAFVRGEPVTLYTVTDALEGATRSFLRDPTDIGIQAEHREARAERKVKRAEEKADIENMRIQYCEQLKELEYTRASYLSEGAMYKQALSRILESAGVTPVINYVEAVVRLKCPLYVGQGSLASQMVAGYMRYTKKVVPDKYDNYQDLKIMFGAFYANTILSNDGKSGFRDIFNQSAEIIGSRAKAKSLDQWLSDL